MLLNKIIREKINSKLMLTFTILSCLLVVLIFFGLYYKSSPLFTNNSIKDLLFSSEWFPLKGKFGLLPFISSTIWVTLISVIIAIPFSLLTAIYLTEYADKRFVRMINPLIDILAGLPSVIFGIWGVIMIVPFIKNHIAPALGISSGGYCLLAGGIVLAVMILPVIIHVVSEVFRAIPQDLKNASLSLGATQWQTIKYVVIRKSMPGIIAAIVLGLSRAFGETLAVLMVVGNVVKMPHSVFDPAYPLPALIANNYGEMLSIPLYDSALMFSALILFVIVLIFNVISRIILVRIERSLGIG
ncbi:MAG: phosphate ABC transporter permease subunit PstC [Bacteroidota bacterium]|nr:phosphate ABC transporter permease subunit PstC [Bacteroidota bacterium]